MRILVVSYGYAANDVSESSSAYTLVQHIRKFHEVSVLTKDSALHVNDFRLPVRSLLSGSKFQRALKLDYFQFMLLAYRFARHSLTRYDLIHHISPISLRYPNTLCNLPLPFIWGPIGGSISYPPGFESIRAREPGLVKLRALDKLRMHADPLIINTLRSSSAIVLTSRAAAELVPQRYRAKTTVIPELVETPDNFRTIDSVPNTEYIFSSGRFVPYKGMELLVRAFNLANIGDNVQLWISGDGPEFSHVQTVSRSLGRSDRIRFLGRISKEENLKLMRDSLFCVFPALKEAFGHVNIEAMSLGKPIIAVKWGGPADLVDDGITGISIRPLTPDQLVKDLAAAITRLSNAPSLRRAMSESARERVRKLYSSDAIVGRHLQMYEDVIRDYHFKA